MFGERQDPDALEQAAVVIATVLSQAAMRGGKMPQ
jgi:hypothetical protein